MLSLNCWRNCKAQISIKLSLIIEVKDVIENYCKMSIIVKWLV